MSGWKPNYDDELRIYSGPVIDRGILGKDDVPKTYTSKEPFFFVAMTGPLPQAALAAPSEAVPDMDYDQWLFEWHEERGGWLFTGHRR